MDNLGDQNKTDQMKKLDFHKLSMVSSLQRQSSSVDENFYQLVPHGIQRAVRSHRNEVVRFSSKVVRLGKDWAYV